MPRPVVPPLPNKAAWVELSKADLAAGDIASGQTLRLGIVAIGQDTLGPRLATTALGVTLLFTGVGRWLEGKVLAIRFL